MGRRYSSGKGVSGSTKPSKQENPSWVGYKPAEIEALVAKLAKEKLTGAQIGLKLRDAYGIPSVRLATSKTVTQILEEKKLAKSLPQDLIDSIARAIQIQKHLESNKQDKAAARGLSLANSRIGRLAKYYKITGKIPADWKYDPSIAGMYLE